MIQSIKVYHDTVKAMIYLTFGVSRAGDWVAIDEVESGKTDLTCPWCEARLIARKGEVMGHHFAHDGETCREASEAVRSTQVPFFETYEVLDLNERKYLERRKKYQHRNMFSWQGRQGAVERLEAMGVLAVERQASEGFKEARVRLARLGYVCKSGELTNQLKEVFEALSPLVDVEEAWYKENTITGTKILPEYHRNKTDVINTIKDIERVQMWWFIAFWKRQRHVCAEYLEFLEGKYAALHRQHLYIARFHGDFNNEHEALIKIGKTSRTAEQRLKEVTQDLLAQGFKAKGEVLLFKENAGRLERILHKINSVHNVPLGSFREFFTDEVLSSLEELKNIQIQTFKRPVDELPRPTISFSGRKKMTDKDVIEAYPEVVDALNKGIGIRKAARKTGRAVNTIQKVRQSLKKLRRSYEH